MSRTLVSMIVLMAFCLPASAGETQWIPLSDARFQIDGLPFHSEDPGQLWRFPSRAKDVVPPAVWNLAQCPSGGRIRFQSDSTSLAIRMTYPTRPGMRNMHSFGQAGLDAYVDGEYIGSVAPGSATEVESFFYSGAPKRVREITIYLPLYLGVAVNEIGIDPDASLQATEKSYAVDFPVVYYGTSITQGGCASRPGMSYQAILGRRLNVDFANFGFSGAGKGEPAVASLLAEVTASCYVIDMAQNNPNAEALQSVYLPLIETIRKAHPETPILCTTPIYMTTELPGSDRDKNLSAMREVIRDAVRARIAAGDKRISIVEGYTLLGPRDGCGFVDGVHPNDLGFEKMANGLEPHLRVILGLQ